MRKCYLTMTNVRKCLSVMAPIERRNGGAMRERRCEKGGQMRKVYYER